MYSCFEVCKRSTVGDPTITFDTKFTPKCGFEYRTKKHKELLFHKICGNCKFYAVLVDDKYVFPDGYDMQ